MSQRGPQKSRKNDQGRIFRGLGGEHKTELRPGFQKVRFCYYLLHLSQAGRLKKRPSLGTILVSGFVKKRKKGVPKIIKNQVKKTLQSAPQNGTIWGSFRDPLQSNSEFGFSGSTLDRLGSILGSFWGHFRGHFLWFWMPFANSFCFLSCLNWALK